MASSIIPHARKHSCSKIFQLGDFGFIWRGDEAQKKLRKLNRLLDNADLDLHFLPGNHEDHDKLAQLGELRRPRTPEGHIPVTKRIFYAGRVSSWEWAGKRFAAVGGAVSIDRGWRIAEERKGYAKSWWPEETLNADEVVKVMRMKPVDVLLTHDAPLDFPDRWLQVDAESEFNRRRMSDFGRSLQPKLMVHGHYHHSLWYEFRHQGGVCRVRALACDGISPVGATMILDLAKELT